MLVSNKKHARAQKHARTSLSFYLSPTRAHLHPPQHLVLGGAFPIMTEYFVGLVTRNKYEGRFDVCLPPETIVMFTSGAHRLHYLVRKCVDFNCITDALRQYGVERLVPDALSIDDALVVYYKIATLEGAARLSALREPSTVEEVAAAQQWDDGFATSKHVFYVWEGEVVSVPRLLPSKLEKNKKTRTFYPTPFVAQNGDKRTGVLLVAFNYADPKRLAHRDALRANLVQQASPLTRVWGISQQTVPASATYREGNIRIDDCWDDEDMQDLVTSTQAAFLCPNWFPEIYLGPGEGYGDKVFEVMLTKYFAPGGPRVFTIPLDAKNRMEEQADKFYRNHETAGTTPTFWLYYLSRDEVHDFNHLFRATLLGEARAEYNNCLAPYMRSKIGVQEFNKLNPETPYALLYSDFFGLPHDDSVRKALRHVMFTFRNTANAVVPRVIGRARTPGGTWGFSLAPQHCVCTEINRCVCPLPPTPPVVETEEVGDEELQLPHDGVVAEDQYVLAPVLPAPAMMAQDQKEVEVPPVPSSSAPSLPVPKPGHKPGLPAPKHKSASDTLLVGSPVPRFPRLSRESDMEISKLRAQIQIHGKQKRTIWQVYGCHPVNQWYNTSKEAVSEVEYMGGYAVDHVLRTGETIECAPGARTPESLGFCVRECFHLLGHTEVQLPNHVPLKQCLQALSNDPAFTLLKPSGWPMHDVPLRQPISIASFLAKYKAGHYVLQVHVSDVGTNLHCIAVRGQQVADPEDGIWRPLTAESFASLSIDEVNFGLAVQGRAGGGDGGVVMQQAAGGTEVDGQGRPVKTNESCSLACLTSTPGRGESLASTPDVRGVRDNSAFSRSPAEPSGQHGRMESASAIPSSTAQQCFQLLGETAALLPPHATLKVCLQVFSKSTFLLRKPNSWDISLPLVNPVSVPVFLQAYKPGRYVLQVSVSPAGKGMHFVAIDGQRMADPADCIWLRLTEESFTLLSITRVISGLQLVPR